MLSLSLACLLLTAIDNVVHHASALPTTAQQMVPVPAAVPRAIERRHAPFMDVRTRLKVDHSGSRGDPKEKYFHESTVWSAIVAQVLRG